MARSIFDEIQWAMPTESQMKIIEARRERSDKISKLMGDYLLKGYKMLGITCRECGTILLQDPRGKYYCVACKELDSDTDKDNPVVNQTAALTQEREQKHVTTHDEEDFTDPVTSQIAPPQRLIRSSSFTLEPEASITASLQNHTQAGPPPSPQTKEPEQPTSSPLQTQAPEPPTQITEQRMEIQYQVPSHNQPRLEPTEEQAPKPLSSSISALRNKIDWACGELERSMSVEYSIQLSQLIKSCADAMHSCVQLNKL